MQSRTGWRTNRSTAVVETLEQRSMFSGSMLAATTAGRLSAQASIAYLDEAMDQFNARFPVYDDASSAGNHFVAVGFLPDANVPVTVDTSWTARRHTGATAMRCTFRPDVPFAGMSFLNGVLRDGQTAPEPNMGLVPEAGIDLQGATSLTFWARGKRGGEQIQFFMGGAGHDHGSGAPLPGVVAPDSTASISTLVTLASQWRQYTIDLGDADLSYVLAGFGWAASRSANPNGAVFFVDDVQYNLDQEAQERRLNLPRFIKSYATLPARDQRAPVGDFDLRFRNAAFTYDNALAILAFLTDGTSDSTRRATLIGDAFIYASRNDRTLTGGALRSVYDAGDIALPPGWIVNGTRATVAAPGFYDEPAHTFRDLWTQGDDLGALDVGNNAWAMIAELALYRRTGKPKYLLEAKKLAAFIESYRSDAGEFQGFWGGTSDPESALPIARPYASTEHNIDVYAAFRGLWEITRNGRWEDDSQHARQFVEAMWDPSVGAYRAGTLDAAHRNELVGQLPLDVQAWSVLAFDGVLGTHPALLTNAAQQHRASDHGTIGYDFNDDKDGVWLEGTGQMAVAYAVAGRQASARAVQRTLQRAQAGSLTGDHGGLVATPSDSLSTGFSFSYFRRTHVGATAWNVFAQLGVNPYGLA